jgi:hypothetical protein
VSGWDSDGFDAAIDRLMQRRDVPPVTNRYAPAPVNPGPCSARCCKTPYGHAQQVRSCPCHPEGSIR